MGNCWPSPVDVQYSPTKTIPSSPERTTTTNAENVKNDDKSGALADAPPSGRIMTPDLKVFTFAELKSATRNFRPDTVLGEGGFGRVFKGWIDEKTYAPSKVGVGIAVAVKKSNSDSDQGLKEWKSEVEFLGKFSHQNLVKLLGYCWEEKDFLLVYEYVQKGSLENHLFKNGAVPLTWSTRINIAIGAARGLAFLHTTEKSVIYRDFKPSNILLDSNYNAKLSDFGLARLGPSDGDTHVTTKVIGTYGYAAPEFVATGHLYLKSDVYGFGVVLLELLTGGRAVDTNRPSGEHNLVEWAKPFLADQRKVKKIVDRSLEDQYPSKGAFQTAELVQQCVQSNHRNRPSMAEVLGSLILIDAIKMNPKDQSKAHRRHPTAQHRQDPANNRHHRSPYHPKPGGSHARNF